MSLLLALGGGASGQTVAPGLLTNGQAFPSPTVSPGAVSLLPSLLANAHTFFSPTVSGTSPQALLPPLLTSAGIVFSPTIPGAAMLSQAGAGARFKARRRVLSVAPWSPTWEALADDDEPIVQVAPIPKAKRKASAAELMLCGAL